MRINKFIASAGKFSRREADKLIDEGKIKINGRVAKLGDQAEITDKVTMDGKELSPVPQKYYIAFNKPFGVITTTNPENENNIMEYIHTPVRLFPVGRLDVHSTGLILLTNDGDTAQKLMKSENKKEKEYMVTLEKPIKDSEIKQLTYGVILDDGKKTLPAQIKRIHENQISIILIQGMNRQVRRMCEAIGHQIKVLTRVRIAGIVLGDLPRGKWRSLTDTEIRSIL